MKSLRIVDSGLRNARENLSVTEALCRLHRAGQGEGVETFRFQHFPPSAIIGRHQVLEREVNLAFCAQSGIGTARRMTGGGAIVMGPGILGWELILSRKHVPQNLGAVAELICGGVAAGLQKLRVPAAFRPRNDVEVEGRKVCGTGGYFDGDTLVFQGTVLVELDEALLTQALHLPAHKLGKRGLDSLKDRVTDLKTVLGHPVPMGDVQAALAHSVASALGLHAELGSLTQAEEALAREVFEAEIGRDAFVEGYDDAFAKGGATLAHRHALPFGEIEVALKLREGKRVDQVMITGDFFVTPPRIIADLEAHLRQRPLAELAASAAAFLEAQGAAFLGLAPTDMVAAIAGAAEKTS
ncbi:MAG: lipoate--protein ligase family protein [Proteobacteria bacterium]|nr:lipoate--protein ligase family protein [Pseudomonadota bacterium]